MATNKNPFQKILLVSFWVAFVIVAVTFSYPFSQRYKQFVFSGQHEGFKEKVWAHRVNSIGKAVEASSIYQGIEMDVVFDKKKNTFDVNHPPVQSIDLALETLLASLSNPSSLSYWLDYKNLEKGSVKAAVTRLLELSRLFTIKKTAIIVESEHPDLLLAFAENGFRTSYYLPLHFLSTIEGKKDSDLSVSENQALSRLRDAITGGDFDYISMDSKFYRFAAERLPGNKDILLWNTALEHHKFFDRKKIKNILSADKRIQVLLTQFESRYDR